MPIYAIAIDGPLDQPNRKFYVEVITQLDTLVSGRFKCRELASNHTWELDERKLKLVWLDEKQVKEFESQK